MRHRKIDGLVGGAWNADHLLALPEAMRDEVLDLVIGDLEPSMIRIKVLPANRARKRRRRSGEAPPTRIAPFWAEVDVQPTALPLVDAIAYHTYGAVDYYRARQTRIRTRQVVDVAEGEDLPAWMTEFSNISESGCGS